MAGSKHGRGSDQVSLRLPEGLRDRIKAAAESRGRSMNAEIIRILEREFPEPWSLAHRVDDLLGLLSAVQEASGDEMIDKLSAEMLATVEGIASGRVVDVDEDARKRVREILDDYWQAQAEDEQNRRDGADY